MKRTSLLLFIGIILLVFVAGFSGYKYWEKSALDQDLKKVEVDLVNVKNKLITYEDEQIKNAINAKRSVDSLDLVKWSVVIEAILDVLPSNELVNIVSYSASSTDTLSMSIKTFPVDDNPYLDIADFIEYFDESATFLDNFVSSISSGTDDEGEEILTFSFTNSYVGDFDYNSSSIIDDEEKVERDS